MSNKTKGFIVLGALVVLDQLLDGAIRKQAASLGVSSGALAAAGVLASAVVAAL